MNKLSNSSRAIFRISTVGLVQVATCLVILASLARFSGSFHRYLELASHFVPQYFVVAIFCLVVLVISRNWKWCIAALLCVLLNGVALAPWYLPASRAQTGQQKTGFKIVFANVNTSNSDYAAVIDLVNKEEPGIFVAQEVNPRWLKKLGVLRRQFPYSKARARRDNFGIAIFSRYQFDYVDIIFWGAAGVPSISARVNIGGETISIISTHPLPPIDGKYYDARNDQLEVVANTIRQMKLPTILIGDLNTSMWSPYYLKLVQKTGLLNARRGFGILPTWPTTILTQGVPFMMIPIDHCLLSPHFNVASIKNGTNISSDHLPLIVELEI